jgi:hypothetical protein
MIAEQKDSFNRWLFFVLMIGLITIVLIDTSIVKIYDIVNKNFLPTHEKVLLFSINSFACLFLEFLIIRYIRRSFLKFQPNLGSASTAFYAIFIISLVILIGLFGYLTFQMFYGNTYYTIVSAIVIFVTYTGSSFFLVALSTLFASWYNSNRNSIILLYSISIGLILSNLVLTAAYSIVSINDRPDEIRQFVGGSMNISPGRHVWLHQAYTVSSILSFVSLWITTSLLMKNYRDNLIRALAYWIVLALPLLYYSISFFYRLLFGSLLNDYLTLNPFTVSIALTAILSLSRPIGGLTFGIVFWRISKRLRYEKKITTYMIISGWGILLLFATNQATSQSVVPYPPFGLVTNTALLLASYLMLIGIYNSARLVSLNSDLRRTIYKHAFESKLLNLIGTAEMDRELQKTVTTILRDKDIEELNKGEDLDLDAEELKKHLDFVIKEVKKTEVKE